MRTKLVAFSVLAVAFVGGAALGADPDRKGGKGTIAADASEGPRDLPKALSIFHEFAAKQPYGRSYKELIAVAPPPKDPNGLGEAKTHPDLKKDPIELQAQVQYLEETDTEARYGFVSLRGMRAFKYGKLLSVQIVVDRIGRDPATVARWKEDVEALATAFKDPGQALGLGPAFKIERNDLVEKKQKSPGTFPEPPLRIEIAPAQGGQR